MTRLLWFLCSLSRRRPRIWSMRRYPFKQCAASAAFARLPLLGLACIIVGGCAKYEIALVDPAEFSQTLQRQKEAILHIDPVEYRFSDVNGRLGVRVFNTTGDPLTMLGEQSYIVDPGGQTHPLRGGTIAPDSFIAFALPPIATVYRERSRLSFGLGVGHHSHLDGHFGGFGTSFDHDPWKYRGFENVPAWRWKTGTVRMRLVFDTEPEPLAHEFTFVRERVD